MQKTDRLEKRKTVLWLLVIYACSVLVRYLLALATKNFPTVTIDEFLYYSLGRSIATEGSLLYFGQPATYNYIVYPLILSPVYLLFGSGTNYFRMIELWNIILMSLSVFPIYALCNALFRKQKTALWLTALFMLTPGFILGEFVYSEAIIYPMFYTLMYCAYQYLNENKRKYTILIGVLGGLLYYTKPGTIAPALIAFAFLAGMAAKRKSGKDAVNVLTGVGFTAVVIILIKIVSEQVFGYQGSLMSVYDEQVNLSQQLDIDRFFGSVGKYPFYFVLSSGILPFVVSIWHYEDYNKENKQYYLFLMSCALLTMIGIAWFINRPGTRDLVFLRYIEMYLPFFFVYSILQKEEQPELTAKPCKAAEILCYIILAYVIVCTIVWGSTTGIGYSNDTHFLISLAVLFTPNVTGIANVLIILLSAITLYLLAGKTKRKTVSIICCIVFVLLTMANNVLGYKTTGDNTDKKLADETADIHQKLNGKEYVHVYADDQCDYGLDVNNRRNTFRISSTDFNNVLLQNNGKYASFVPSSARGMTAVYATPEVETLIVDEKIYKRTKFSDKCSSFISLDDSFDVISFSKGDQIVDCILSGGDYPTLAAGEVCSLRVFKEGWLQNPVKIRLEIENETAGRLDISTIGGVYSLPLTAGRYWYQFVIADPVGQYDISVSNDYINIYDYEIATAEQTQ